MKLSTIDASSTVRKLSMTQRPPGSLPPNRSSHGGRGLADDRDAAARRDLGCPFGAASMPCCLRRRPGTRGRFGSRASPLRRRRGLRSRRSGIRRQEFRARGRADAGVGPSGCSVCGPGGDLGPVPSREDRTRATWHRRRSRWRLGQLLAVVVEIFEIIVLVVRRGLDDLAGAGFDLGVVTTGLAAPRPTVVRLRLGGTPLFHRCLGCCRPCLARFAHRTVLRLSSLFGRFAVGHDPRCYRPPVGYRIPVAAWHR